MHTIEPHYNWIDQYSASEDPRSPLFEAENSLEAYTNTIYGYYIHPQWDSLGSDTLFFKILFADYEDGIAILEFIGEWNDAIENDIMELKRNIVDVLVHEGIRKFILVGENVFNFHGSDDDYYEEWFEDVEEGWIAGVNFQEHVQREMRQYNVDNYVNFGGQARRLALAHIRAAPPLRSGRRPAQPPAGRAGNHPLKDIKKPHRKRWGFFVP
ncbi:hypothetical protein ACFQT0_01035 [Hymenobacter humi]|uniref:Uncharacterized protein n=1 Tax=Hymenobacter humi TaxID=1411620 RepID=A0ABW2TYA2_9BACT